MKPYPQTLEMYQGDYFDDLFFRVRDRVWNPALNGGAGGWEPGAYTDLTGWSGNFQVKAALNSDLVMAQGEVQITEGTVPETMGSVLVVMTEVETAKLVPGNQFYDVELTDAAGHSRTYLAGKAVVTGDVSRDVVP